MIHELSRRTVAKFQAVNCAALPTRSSNRKSSLRERRVTGAHDRKPGRLELANEARSPRRDRRHVAHRAGEAPARLEEPIERLGGHKSISVDFRLISGDQPSAREFSARRTVP